MKKLLILFFAASLYTTHAQEKHTISGYLKDSKNGEALIGVTVYKKNSQIATSTNAYGFYSLTLSAGLDTIVFSYVGYKTLFIPINLTANQTISYELAEEGKELATVEVSSEKEDKNVTSVKDLKFHYC